MNTMKKFFVFLISACAVYSHTAATNVTHSYHCLQADTAVEPYYILSIDGGGVRGVIPIEVLMMLEEELGANVVEIFDEIVGTSTGGIIALASSLPSDEDPTKPKYSASDIQDLYEQMASHVFTSSTYYKIKTGWGADGPKYPSPHDVLYALVGDVRLDQLIANKVLVTSVDALTENLVLFTNTPETTDILFDRNIEVITLPPNIAVCDAVEATSAAPTYFPSKVLGEFNLLDGGVAINNPAQLASFLALNRVDKNRPIVVLSLGTGVDKTAPIKKKETLDWGWMQWAALINEYFLDSASVVANEQLLSLAENNPERFSYIRFQVTLDTPEEGELDNAAPENLLHLRALAHTTFQDFLDNQGGREALIEPLKRKLHRN